MKIKDLMNRPAEKISQGALYVMTALTVVVLALFYLVGYDVPFEENPDFNAPLFTDLLMALMYVLLVCAVAIAVCSAVKAARFKTREGEDFRLRSRLTCSVWGGLLAVLIITFLAGSSQPIPVNGETYADWLWLKLSDMFVLTSVILLVAGAATVLFGATRYVRKGRKQ